MQKKKILNAITLSLVDLSKCKLNIEQAETIESLLSEDEFVSNMNSTQSYSINKARKSLQLKFGFAIGMSMNEIEDLEEIKGLIEKITPDMEKNNYSFFINLKSQLRERMQQIQKKSIFTKQRNNITPRIEAIIGDLAKGDFNYMQALEIIRYEAEQKVKDSPQSRFTLTIEKEVNQTIVQIRHALVEQADKYPLEDPESAIENLIKMDSQKRELAINTVIKNMTDRKQFDEAREICNKYVEMYQVGNPTLSGYVMNLKKDIAKSEISQFVLEGLESEMTPTEEKEFLETIQTKLAKENIKMSSIILGRKDASSKPITLEDVYDGGEYVRAK